MQNKEKLFHAFVQQYDRDDAIQLKIIHTAHVAKLAEDIAQALGLSMCEQALANTIGWLHDIGRFEQWQRYQTFIDSQSIDHAALSVSLLTAHHTKLLRAFSPNPIHDEMICFAIAQHNRYQLAEHPDPQVMTHAKIIRDADKIDIFRVNQEASEALLYLCDRQTLEHDVISDHVYTQLIAHKSIVSTQRETHLDILVSHLAMVFDFNFCYAKKRLYSLGYIQNIFKKYRFSNEQTIKRMKTIEQLIMVHLQKT